MLTNSTPSTATGTATSPSIATNFPSLSPSGPLSTISTKVLIRFGCPHCEWKYGPKCPVYSADNYEINRDNVKSYRYPKQGICEKRLFWLTSFLPVYEDVPSSSMVMLDLLKGLGHNRHLKDTEDLCKLEQLVIDLEKECETECLDPAIDKKRHKQLNILHHRLSQKRKTLETVWRELIKIEDNQVDRETVKKSEITTKSISPIDIAEWIEKSDVQDVDYTELDSDTVSKKASSSFNKEVD